MLDFIKNFTFTTDFSLGSWIYFLAAMIFNLLILIFTFCASSGIRVAKDYDDNNIWKHISFEDIQNAISNLKSSPYKNRELFNFFDNFERLSEKYRVLLSKKNLLENSDSDIAAFALYMLFAFVILRNIYCAIGFWFSVIAIVITVPLAYYSFLFVKNSFMSLFYKEDWRTFKEYSEKDRLQRITHICNSSFQLKNLLDVEYDISRVLIENRIFCIEYELKELSKKKKIFQAYWPIMLFIIFALNHFKF